WGAVGGQGEAAPAAGLDQVGFRARLDETAAPDERYVVFLCSQRSVALRKIGRYGAALATGRSGAVSRQYDRPQRARRAAGLAAIGAATRGQSADAAARVGKGRNCREGPCRRRSEGRPPANGLRGSGRTRKLPAQSIYLALEPVRILRQGTRILSAPFPRHAARPAGQGSRRNGRPEAQRGDVARSGAGGE